MAAPPPSADSRCFGDRKGEEDCEEGYCWRTNIPLLKRSHCRPLSTQSWLVNKARRVGQTPKADSLVWFMSVLMGISEEPPHSIVHWYGISIIPPPSILFSKRLVHPLAPCYWRALILWAALLCEISAKELQVSHLLDGMFNPLETNSPFPVGAGAVHSTIAALFLHPCLGCSGADQQVWCPEYEVPVSFCLVADTSRLYKWLSEGSFYSKLGKEK